MFDENFYADLQKEEVAEEQYEGEREDYQNREERLHENLMERATEREPSFY